MRASGMRSAEYPHAFGALHCDQRLARTGWSASQGLLASAGKPEPTATPIAASNTGTADFKEFETVSAGGTNGIHHALCQGRKGPFGKPQGGCKEILERLIRAGRKHNKPVFK